MHLGSQLQINRKAIAKGHKSKESENRNGNGNGNETSTTNNHNKNKERELTSQQIVSHRCDLSLVPTVLHLWSS